MQPETNSKIAIHFVEEDTQVRAEIARVCMSLGHHCEPYSDLGELSVYPPRAGIILVRDCPTNGGIGYVMERLMALGIWLPVVAMDYNPLPGRVVDAVKAGALDYLALPLKPERLASCLARIEREAAAVTIARQRAVQARRMLSSLSGREREVLDHLSMGGSNKEIARQLEISPRTVEIHRANMMTKLGARHAAEAIRVRLEASVGAGSAAA